MKAGINQKLLGSFLAGLVLFLLSVGASLLVINELMKATGELEAITRKVELTGDLRLHLHTLLTPVNNYLITGDKNERDNFDRTLAKISGVLAELKGFGGDEKWEAQAKEVGDGAINLSEKVISALFIENPVGNKRAAALMGEINLLSGSVIHSADEFHDITRDDVARESKAIASQVKRLKIFFVFVIVLALSVTFFLAFYVSNSITRPILQMRRGAGIIAAGDLSHRLDIRSGDEIGELAEEFNSMTSSLSLAMHDLDRKMKNISTLYQVTSILGAGFEVKSLLRHIVIELAERMEIDDMAVFLVDEGGRGLSVAACTHPGHETSRISVLRVGSGLIGKAVLDGKVRVVDNVSGEAGLAEGEISFLGGAGTMVVIPFGTRGKISGVMTARRGEDATFASAETEMLTAIAEHVALAVENAGLYEQAKHPSTTGGFTGLLNRQFFKQRLFEDVQRSARYQRPISLLLMDIDHFENYNDIHGRAEGDVLLQMVVGILRNEVRNSDIMARNGGEGFVIMAPETDRGTALAMAERLRKRVAEYPFPYGELQPGGNLTVSIGVASFPDDSADADELVKKADSALTEAKSAGRNKVMCPRRTS